MTAPLCFLDTETDGIHPGRKPWEVAIIRRNPDGQQVVMHTFVQIGLSTADPFGLSVGRFYDRHPAGRQLTGRDSHGRPGVQSEADVAFAVATITHGAHLVGAVPNFDSEVLDRLLREHDLIPAWHYHLIDVETLAVGYLAAKGAPMAPPWKSDDLSRAVGVEPPSEEERHTAIGDARWAMRLYDAIVGVGTGQQEGAA
jgi:hypothetical protein